MTSTIDALKKILDGLPPEQRNDAAQLSSQLLLEADAKRTELHSRLQHGIWMVEFTKVDGTPSIMECTLDKRFVPAGDSTAAARPHNPTLLHVYALDRQGWRSFKVLNVQRFYPKPDNL